MQEQQINNFLYLNSITHVKVGVMMIIIIIIKIYINADLIINFYLNGLSTGG